MGLLLLLLACTPAPPREVAALQVSAGWSVPVADFVWPPIAASCAWYSDPGAEPGRLAVLQIGPDARAFMGRAFDSDEALHEQLRQDLRWAESCPNARRAAVLVTFDAATSYDRVTELLYFVARHGADVRILVDAATAFPPFEGCDYDNWTIGFTRAGLSVTSFPPTPVPSPGGHRPHTIGVDVRPALTWGEVLAGVSPHLQDSILFLSPSWPEESAVTAWPTVSTTQVRLDGRSTVTVLPWKPPVYDGPCSTYMEGLVEALEQTRVAP
ncbi:MAG: hypothetical protein V4850_22630 [Myxococcota bacterium]